MDVVIHHNDPDGLLSAYAVALHCNFRNLYHYRYAYKPAHENYIRGKLEHLNVETIFVVDCTLSDDFMRTYAPKIVHIDHHVSRIEPQPDWFNSVKAQFSEVGTAACVLTYRALFGTVPPYAELIGQYDIGNFTKESVAMSNYFHNYLRESDYFKPLDIDVSDALKLGEQITEVRRVTDLKNAEKAIKADIMDDRIFVLCTAEKRSSIFTEYAKYHPDVKGVMLYSVTDWGFDALGFCKRLVMNFNPLSFGGHAKACGATLPLSSVDKFLSYVYSCKVTNRQF